MKNEKDIPYNLFAKFFSSEISEKEQAELDKFIAEDPENENIFHEYEIIWSAESSDYKFEVKTEDAQKKVKTEFNREINHKRNNRKIIYRIAASVIIMLGLAYISKVLFVNNETNYITLESGNETIQTELPDGSIIWLNKHSIIKYPEQFSNNERRVTFSGEAYFKIAHNPKIPFIIESQHTETKVLGTEFNLRSENEENIIELTLVEGKVLFTDKETDESETINKKETVTLNKQTREINKRETRSENHLYWKTKELNLDGLSLEEISTELNTIFNITVKADSSVSKMVYNQSLPFKDSDILEILNVIKYTLNLEIDTINGTIILKK